MMATAAAHSSMDGQQQQQQQQLHSTWLRLQSAMGPAPVVADESGSVKCNSAPVDLTDKPVKQESGAVVERVDRADVLNNNDVNVGDGVKENVHEADLMAIGKQQCESPLSEHGSGSATSGSPKSKRKQYQPQQIDQTQPQDPVEENSENVVDNELKDDEPAAKVPRTESADTNITTSNDTSANGGGNNSAETVQTRLQEILEAQQRVYMAYLLRAGQHQQHKLAHQHNSQLQLARDTSAGHHGPQLSAGAQPQLTPTGVGQVALCSPTVTQQSALQHTPPSLLTTTAAAADSRPQTQTKVVPLQPSPKEIAGLRDTVKAQLLSTVSAQVDKLFEEYSRQAEARFSQQQSHMRAYLEQQVMQQALVQHAAAASSAATTNSTAGAAAQFNTLAATRYPFYAMAHNAAAAAGYAQASPGSIFPHTTLQHYLSALTNAGHQHQQQQQHSIGAKLMQQHHGSNGAIPPTALFAGSAVLRDAAAAAATGGSPSSPFGNAFRKKRSKVTDTRLNKAPACRDDGVCRNSPSNNGNMPSAAATPSYVGAPTMVGQQLFGMKTSSSPTAQSDDQADDMCDEGIDADGNSTGITSTLSPVHLRKAKLMFFYVRYPSSSVIKSYFPDIRFNKNNTAQLVKWFSNFREFYYIQMEKYAKQALEKGVRSPHELVITVDSELYKVLNQHYNRNTHIQVPSSFRSVAEATLREFFLSIQAGRDADPGWKKAIYKVIARLDEHVPEYFKTQTFLESLE